MSFVALGTLATFAIFAATTITNVPAPGTVIGGDMGIFPGAAFTGFPPGLVTGTMYGAGSFAGIVKGDALIAFNDAAGQAFTTTLSNTDLSGLTLLPGVYKFDAAAALSAGDLFLDANGNPDAVWIFQIGTSLNIAAKSAMFFTSGVGNPNNVVWQVGTSVTLNPGCAIIGNVLANTVIALMSKASVNGRLISLNGAVTLIKNTVSFPDMTPSVQPSAEPSSAPSISHAPTVSFAPTSPSAAPTIESKKKKKLSSDGGSVDSDNNVGLIVGLVVGGVALVAIVAATVVYKGKQDDVPGSL